MLGVLRIAFNTSLLVLLYVFSNEAAGNSIEGVWRISEESVEKITAIFGAGEPLESPIRICNGGFSFTSNLLGKPLTVDAPYRIVGGNSSEVRIELLLDEDVSVLRTIRTTKDGLVVSGDDCRENPSICRAIGSALIDAFSDQSPDVDLRVIRAKMAEAEFSESPPMPSKNYVFVESCESNETTPNE